MSASSTKKQLRAAVVTLGCARNQVDSEIFLGLLKEQGYLLTSDLEQAEIIIVNTCGFLEAAVKESIDCILELSEYKEQYNCKKLIVAGCLVSRYQEDLEKSLPEVDGFLNTNQISRIEEVLSAEEKAFSGEDSIPFLYDEKMPRVLSGPQHLAYLKISEGCSHKCSFCTIPTIRGPLRSRFEASILKELGQLSAQGVKEVNLVAEDLTAYGTDLSSGEDCAEIRLSSLLEKIDQSGLIPRIRLLYAYPTGVTEKLLDCLVNLPSVCEYLDLPLQHSSEAVLKRMNRPLGFYRSKPLVEWIKTGYPEVHLRTTFLVGFPGETEEDIDDLEKFISEGYFTGVGVFIYSHEEGTAAFLEEDSVSHDEKEHRRERLMLAQQRVNEKRLKSFHDQVLEVMVDGLHQESDLLISGRTRFQAPEEDGCVIINDSKLQGRTLEAGDLLQAKITDSLGYDLIATAVAVI